MKRSSKLLASALSVALLTSCGTDDAKTELTKGMALLPTSKKGRSVKPAPSPTVITEPDVTGGIASNFDINLALQTSWGTGAIASSGTPDVVGAFRFICRPGQVAAIDPIVNPGPRGTRSHHLHQFFGNTKVFSDSTYASLRAEGGSTCNEVGDPNATGAVSLNRSAYWLPAMLDGTGNVVRPNWVSIYYKRRPASDPKVSDPASAQFMGMAADLPHGLKFIFGRDMADLTKAPTGNFHFNCLLPSGANTSYKTMGEAVAACPLTPDANGKMASLTAVGDAPSCWDGVNLDSANHRSHVAYPTYGSWGYLKCPSTHPRVIPTFTMSVNYTLDANAGSWKLASDEMMGQPAGSTYHADFFMAWDPTIHRLFHDHCINKLLNCSGGDLGNGQQLRGSSSAPAANPRLIPMPTA